MWKEVKLILHTFANVALAQKYYKDIGGRLQILALATGLFSTVLAGTLGVVGGWAGGIIGSIAGGVGAVSSTVIYGWGSKYIDCANDLSKYKKSKKCSVKWNKHIIYNFSKVKDYEKKNISLF